MRQQEISTYFNEMWANAQIARSLFFKAIIRKGWRRLFGCTTAQCDPPIGNARRSLWA